MKHFFIKKIRKILKFCCLLWLISREYSPCPPREAFFL
nr:MAG TPA: hypothetical protein [Caudoviricetes sp.]